MTNLEICRKIADIEGIQHEDSTRGPYVVFYSKQQGHSSVHDFNPLTDDGLCFRLMVNQVVGKNPNKAICLAIIAEHEQESK